MMIEISDITKTYPTQRGVVTALSGLSLSIPKGSIYGIIGRSGSGKSTLIRCLNLLERPTMGRILFAGTDIGDLAEGQLRTHRRGTGMIFQHFNLLANRTVRGNIALPLEFAGVPKPSLHQTVDRLLATVGLEEQQHRFPAQLSGGQKQRVGIARALALDPRVLLCDEATSALDPETTMSILRLIESINEKNGITVIIVTHEMTVVREICHRVAVLEKGALIEEGTVLDIFSAPRHPTTRGFVREIIAHDLPDELSHLRFRPRYSAGARLIIRVLLTGARAESPILSDLARRAETDIRILYGRADHIRRVPFTSLIVELSGPEPALIAAQNHLRRLAIGIEEYGYVA